MAKSELDPVRAQLDFSSGYAMLMTPNKTETALHRCHRPGDMAVSMRQVLVRLWVGVRVCHFAFIVFF